MRKHTKTKTHEMRHDTNDTRRMNTYYKTRACWEWQMTAAQITEHEDDTDRDKERYNIESRM